MSKLTAYSSTVNVGYSHGKPSLYSRYYEILLIQQDGTENAIPIEK
ncbi:MAG TPA: hypothetical protein VFG45_08865 [Candidatus Nitrosocosmicus sp.]|nr:hypothetical protein [Candidatus Nitrosocosmicus sp.]